VICICLPPLRALLSRQFKFFNQRHKRVTGSDGPYGAHSSAPSELVTIGGSNGMHGRKPINHKRKDHEDSQEELVYFTNENSPPLGESGITKRTEFAVTETHTRGSETGEHMRIKPWEGSDHVS